MAIDYYVNDFDASKTKDLYDNRSKSEIDPFRMGIIAGNIPKSILDLAFIEMLPNVGYTKTQIDPAKFARIDGIFVEKTAMKSVTSPCIYVYREILIFKKEYKVVGTTKICFGCMDYQVNGTTANTENFGQDGDYEKLSYY